MCYVQVKDCSIFIYFGCMSFMKYETCTYANVFQYFEFGFLNVLKAISMNSILYVNSNI